jgi:transcriptional regulator
MLTTDQKRKVFLLLRYQGYTAREIAEYYGVSTPYVSQLAPIEGPRAAGGRRRLNGLVA